jgi:hypothetical protein
MGKNDVFVQDLWDGDFWGRGDYSSIGFLAIAHGYGRAPTTLLISPSGLRFPISAGIEEESSRKSERGIAAGPEEAYI